MNEIFVYDRNINLLGIIDGYISVIWRPAYSDIGDFEIYTNATDKAIELLKENRYVVRAADIEVDENGNTTLKKVMIIKNIIVNTDVENGDFLTVTGRELKYILHQRLIWAQTIVNDTVEAAIRQYINENAINPTDKNRVIPGLQLGELAGFTDTISKQVTASPLDETITEICLNYNYGWDIYIYNNKLIFSLYAGVNRSYEQTDRPYVVFSENHNNLYNSEYQKNTENYANTALVGGEGEGLDRIYTTCNGENAGLDRFEVFVDAGSVRRNEGSEDEIPLAEYEPMLKENGNEALSEFEISEAFTGEILNDVNFVYERDFFLGDIVTVINKYGVQKNVRVVSAIESIDENGTKLIPIYNI